MDANSLDELFLLIIESLMKYSPKLFAALNRDSWKDKFFTLRVEDRKSLIRSLIAIGGGKANVADLTAAGGSKHAGHLAPTYSMILTKGSGITFVDQSITGLFESRTHIGL